MSNQDIRIAMMKANIKQYQVAEELKITETYFSKKLRSELSEIEKTTILNAIRKLEEKNK